MPDDTTASIKISADASGVQPGVQQAKSDLSGLTGFVEQLKAQFASFGESLKTAFSGAAAGTAEASEGMRQFNAETKAESVSLREMAASMKETAAGVHEGVVGFNEFKAGIREAFEAYLAFVGVEMFGEMAEKMGEAAEQTQHLAQRFGMTTDQVQALKGATLATGVSFDTLTRGMALLDRNAEQTPEKFQKLGISIKAGASQMDILLATAARFKDIPDGPTKVAAAMELMGRNGAAMLPILDQGADGLQTLMDKAKEYGEVNAQAVASGVALADSVNEGKMAWDGLKQTLTQAFAPLLTEMVDGFNGLVKAMTASYESGGAVKTVFVAIVDVIEAFGEIFNSIGDAVSQIYKEMGVSAGDWGGIIKTVINDVVFVLKLGLLGFVGLETGAMIAFDDMKGYATLWYSDLKTTFENAATRVDELKIDFQTLGIVIRDALTLNWGDIAADWQAGMSKVAAVAAQGAANIAQQMQAAQGKAQGDFAQGQSKFDSLANWAPGFMKSHAKPQKTGVKDEGGGDGDTPDLAKQPKEAKGPSIVEQWKTQLQEALTEEKNWGVDDAAFTLQFWQEKLGLTKAGSKEELQVRQEVARAKMAVAKEEQADELATIKQALAMKTELAKTETELSKIGLQDKLQAIDEAEKAGRISAVQAVAQRAATNAQLYQLDLDEEQREYAAKLQALNDELAIETLKPQQREAINREIEALEQQHLDRMAVITAQNGQKITKDNDATADAIRSKWQGIFQPIAQAWGQSVQAMIQGTQTLRNMMLNMGNAILQQGIQWVEKLVVKFAAGEAAKIAAAVTSAATRNTVEAGSAATSVAISATSALTQIAHSAAVAAAGAYAAIARIPYVGPVLAPIAAAVALAGVIALGKTVLSAEGGEGEVMGDNVPYLLHRREMVLPAALADSIRAMSTSGVQPMSMKGVMPLAPIASNNNAPLPANANASSSGGDSHVHFHGPVFDKRGIEKFLMDNKPAVHAAVRAHVRQGGATTAL